MKFGCYNKKTEKQPERSYWDVSKNDRLQYGIHGVCTVVDLEVQNVNRKEIEYYVLAPLDQPGARFYVPTQNQAAVSKLKPILTSYELDLLLKSDAACVNTWISDDNQRKLRYRELICSGDRAALIAMLRTLYGRKKTVEESGKKFHLCDDNFMKDAEKILGMEFSVVLGIPLEQILEYLHQQLINE